MKILMLTWEYPPRIVGGIARVVHDLAGELGKNGNEVHVVTFQENGLSETVKDRNVRIHRVRNYDIKPMDFTSWVMQLNYSMIEHANKLISENGSFDIIHVHDWLTAFAGRVLKHSYGIPMLCTIHATEHGRNNGIHNDLQRYINDIEWWLGFEAWRIIVNSQYMKNELMRIFNMPGEKIRIIPNGVNIYKFRGIKRDMEFRRRFAFDNEKIIYFVGRLVREKGVEVILDAMPKILHYYNDVKLVITGKGPESDKLRKKSWDMGIGKRTYFTGYLPEQDLLKMYKCADIAVFPSLYEPFGIVALEGMISGTPVVVSDAGGLDEIVEHNMDGMKSYTGNADSLADSLLELLHNPKKAEMISENALRKVKEKYSRKIIAALTEDLYREILAESSKDIW